MNLCQLTDHNLSNLRQDVAHEIERRSKAATNGHNAATIIFGNELAKRALSIAAAGGHSILFVGPSAVGKSMLRAVALELGLADTFEARPCPCGNRTDPRLECKCSIRQIEVTIRRYPVADINVEMQRPSEREMSQPGTSLADMKKHIEAASKHESMALDENGRNLLKCSVVELGINLDVQNRIMRVARTVANLDQSKEIRPIHLCEAINYRPLRR